MTIDTAMNDLSKIKDIKEKNIINISTSTPLMRQYSEVKSQYSDCIVLFRMGDFFETFNEDAIITAKILGIVLTKRANGAAADVPLAGFPHHALDNYLSKIVNAGHKVAICEQVEDPKLATGIVKREVIEVVSPGTLEPDEESLQKSNNFIVSLSFSQSDVGYAVLDQSTGEFYLGESSEDNLSESLRQFAPREVLIPESYTYITSNWYNKLKPFISRADDWVFDYDHGYRLLTDHFETPTLKGFGCEEYSIGICAAGAMIYQLKHNLNSPLNHISSIKPILKESIMGLDSFTIRNLEIFNSLSTQGTHGTLTSVLDETVSSGGGRLLKKWLHNPLTDMVRLKDRVKIVDLFTKKKSILHILREFIGKTSDLERILGRINKSKASPRDLLGLKNTYELITQILKKLKESDEMNSLKINEWFGETKSLIKFIKTKINEDSPATLKQGGVIARGINSELDELRSIAIDGSEWITKLQSSERERTGIASLKIGYNKVFGYYIEVTKTHLEKVPSEYIRKQTLVNAERYIIPELKEYEEKILSAEEKLSEIENRLFQELCREILCEANSIQKNAESLKKLDILTAFAFLAIQNKYVKPRFTQNPLLKLKKARHPVVERLLPVTEKFIPNDLEINTENNQIHLITGPNMAGKSTYLRQVGLIIIMAQIGCFVPANKAEIGIVDHLFTRVGASDNLAGGESTFLVEMIEAANILNNATQNSLVLLDEVGRGTATFDGLSLAWAITEYLHENPHVAARTLFATHYHELTVLEVTLDRLSNYHTSVQEYKDKIIFLRKIIPGAGDKSYGIHVAKMAGLPKSIIQRANEILLQHINQSKNNQVQSDISSISTQELLFDIEEKKIMTELSELDVDSMTPIEALQMLFDLKTKYRSS